MKVFAKKTAINSLQVTERFSTSRYFSGLGRVDSNSPFRESELMQQYVILRHDFPELHWDLMLEEAGVLKTWRLSAPPAIDHADESSIDLVAEALARSSAGLSGI